MKQLNLSFPVQNNFRTDEDSIHKAENSIREILEVIYVYHMESSKHFLAPKELTFLGEFLGKVTIWDNEPTPQVQEPEEDEDELNLDFLNRYF